MIIIINDYFIKILIKKKKMIIIFYENYHNIWFLKIHDLSEENHLSIIRIRRNFEELKWSPEREPDIQ